MRNMLIGVTALIALLAGTALAEDVPVSVDLKQVCNPGCVVYLDLTEAKFGTESQYAGQFVDRAHNDPLKFLSGFSQSDNLDFMLFQITSEPGQPAFTTIEKVREYMKAHDDLIRDGSPTG